MVITDERIDRDTTSALTDADLAILGEVDGSLNRALQLQAWWERADSHRGGSSSFPGSFPAALTFNRPDESFAFLDNAPMDGAMVPVLGDLQDLRYDLMKAPPGATAEGAEWMRDQIREFVLRYSCSSFITSRPSIR